MLKFEKKIRRQKVKPSLVTSTCDTEALFKLLNSNYYQLTLDGLLKLLWQSALEEAGLLPKEGATTGLKLLELLGLIETLIKLFGATDWNKKLVATTGQGIMTLLDCCEEIPKEMKTHSVQQTSVLHSFM